MGAIVTCGKRVAAFRDKESGEVIYILFESTYEKNCYPHHPHESAVAFGTIEVAMKRIFLSAAGCEGGGLQGQSGQILPENYIAGWMKALLEPTPFNPETNVWLQIGGGHYSFDAEKKDAILEAVTQVGDLLAVKILAEGARVNRQVQSKTVQAIMALGIMPWRLELRHPYGPTDASLGYNPLPVKASTVEFPKLAKLSSIEDRLYLFKDGHWVCTGGSWCEVDRFTQNLWANEIQYPGTYRKLIKQFREHCDAAPILSPTAKVEFSMVDDSAPDWNRSSYERVLVEFGVKPGETKALSDLLLILEDQMSFSYSFHNASQFGLISIHGDAELQYPSPDKPKYEKLKPKAKMIVEYGAASYMLLQPAGSGKGWQVQRVSDGAVFRMKPKQISEALAAMSQQAFKTANDAFVNAAKPQPALQAQVDLF